MPRGAYDVMNLKALTCFFATARHGSLTQAGIELDISEAAVSQRVRLLETFLGAKLYEARGAFFDGRIGTLDVGKLADLAVLSQDIFAVPAQSIAATRVLMTMVGSQVVYQQDP